MRGKEKVLRQVAKAAFYIGKTTATSISRLGSFESEKDEKANRVLREKKVKI